MHSTLAISSLLFALSAYAQSTPAFSSANPTQNSASQPVASGSAGASETGDLEDVVDFLIPSATVTSLSPAQSSQILSDISVYFSGYTASNPLSALQASIIAEEAPNVIFGGATTPSPAQVSSIQDLVGQAQSGFVNNPSGLVSSVNAIISPFGFATEVRDYENGFINGVRTVVASDLSLSVPPATTSSSSTGGVAPARPTGFVAGGVAVAAGLVGAALL